MNVNEKQLSRKRKIEITEKHLEAISNQSILLVYPMFGAVQGRITGKITGRLRNRFRQFMFVPTFPFMTFAFSKHDVKNVEFADKGIVVTLGWAPEPKKRRKKKKPAPKVVAMEPDIDLNEPQPTEPANAQ